VADQVRELARATYAGLGLEMDDILARSDLYPREGKNQHAFCTDIDREGDVRTLNNLQSNRRWTETLLHELGHAVYSRYPDPALPWLLRDCPHTTSTEAIAIMMGSLTYDQEWLEQIAGLKAAEAARTAAAAKERGRAMRLVFSRWRRCTITTAPSAICKWRSCKTISGSMSGVSWGAPRWGDGGWRNSSGRALSKTG
jgi:peptidyl-dipeptidase A